ncbi:MAG: class I SAM-dependent DNA methyltransferase [Myxococcaceae bacterium]
MEPSLYAAHARLEDNHWWFNGRRAVVREVLEQRLGGDAQKRRILDVGCGTGGMLGMLRTFGEVEGIDSSDEALRYARQRMGDAVPLGKGQLPDGIPAGQRYDLITAFDVIEHISDAVESLRAIRKALKPGGALVCTVPAYQFLWSAHDDANHHQRRYDAGLLRAHLAASGFKVQYLSYFNALLFPPIAAVRLLHKVLPEKGGEELDETTPWINAVLTVLFSSERHLLKRTTLPFGVSLIAVATPSH